MQRTAWTFISPRMRRLEAGKTSRRPPQDLQLPEGFASSPRVRRRRRISRPAGGPAALAVAVAVVSSAGELTVAHLQAAR